MRAAKAKTLGLMVTELQDGLGLLQQPYSDAAAVEVCVPLATHMLVPSFTELVQTEQSPQYTPRVCQVVEMLNKYLLWCLPGMSQPDRRGSHGAVATPSSHPISVSYASSSSSSRTTSTATTTPTSSSRSDTTSTTTTPHRELHGMLYPSLFPATLAGPSLCMGLLETMLLEADSAQQAGVSVSPGVLPHLVADHTGEAAVSPVFVVAVDRCNFRQPCLMCVSCWRHDCSTPATPSIHSSCTPPCLALFQVPCVCWPMQQAASWEHLTRMRPT